MEAQHPKAKAIIAIVETREWRSICVLKLSLSGQSELRENIYEPD